MFIGLILLALAGVCTYGASLGGLTAVPLGWTAFSAGVIGVAYLGPVPKVMGKRPDGVVPWWRTLMFGPFVLFTVGMGVVKVRLGREPVFNAVATGVYVGRRCRAKDLPADVKVVVDLTCERTEPLGMRTRESYHSLPTFDGTAPEAHAYRVLLGELVGETRPIYIHCAMGHSRAATVAAGVLIGRGVVDSAHEAERLMKSVRPKVHFTHEQRRLVESYASMCRPDR